MLHNAEGFLTHHIISGIINLMIMFLPSVPCCAAFTLLIIMIRNLEMSENLTELTHYYFCELRQS